MNEIMNTVALLLRPSCQRANKTHKLKRIISWYLTDSVLMAFNQPLLARWQLGRSKRATVFIISFIPFAKALLLLKLRRCLSVRRRIHYTTDGYKLKKTAQVLVLQKLIESREPRFGKVPRQHLPAENQVKLPMSTVPANA